MTRSICRAVNHAMIEQGHPLARKTVSEEQRIAAERQLIEKQSEIHFDVRDFTVKYLVDQFRAGVFYIPEYQRGFVWNNRNRNRFIESMLLGLPIPFMFAADMTDGSLEIVDGAQRIQTLEQFLTGDLRLSGLEQLPALEGFVFADLPGPQARRLENRPMRMIFLEAATTDAIRHEIFSRINTSGERARGSEVRRGAYSGPFMQFVTECASDPLFLKLCPISDAMRKRRGMPQIQLIF